MSVGLLVAIAREQSYAFIYVTRYVHTILIVLTGSGGKLRIADEPHVSRGARVWLEEGERKPVAVREATELDPHSFV